MTTTRHRLTAITMATVLTLSGCTSSGDDPGMRNTITEQQAVQQAKDYILDAAAAVFPGRELKEGLANTIPCDDPSDHGPMGRVTASAEYDVLTVPESDLPRAFDAFTTWLATHDFVVINDDRPKEPHVRAEHRHDGFRLGFAFSPYTGPYFITDSPCVWPNGAPAPKQ